MNDRRLNSTFEEFRDALQQTLAAEAQQSVDDAIERLTNREGPFNLRSARVEVIVHDFELAGRGAGAGTEEGTNRKERPQTRSGGRRKASGSKRRPHGRNGSNGAPRIGRPDGPVRSGLLRVFADAPGEELPTGELRDRLRASGVETSDDNVHQQLRRLVQAGAIERPERGVYTLADESSS